MRVATLTMNPAIDVSTEVARVVPIHKLRCESVRREAGGGGINVARVLSRLGGDPEAIYPVGGPIGELLRRLVEAEGVTSETVALADDTRESFTARETETGEEFRFVLPGPDLSPEECRRCLDAVSRLTPAPDILVASGSLPGGVPDDFYAAVARVAKDMGAKVVVDTSGPALRGALREGVHLVKPNLRELRELVGEALEERDDWIRACRRLIDDGGAEIVALTLGHRGGLLVAGDVVRYAPVLPIEPMSAVGAGDSFLAGMVWGLARGESVEEAFRLGMAAGSAALLSPGTELCRARDIHRLLPQVRLEAV